MRTSWPGTARIVLACLPCLAVLGVFGFAFVGFAAIGAWLSDSALVLAAATAAALMVGTLGGILYIRRGRGAACASDAHQVARPSEG